MLYLKDTKGVYGYFKLNTASYLLMQKANDEIQPRVFKNIKTTIMSHIFPTKSEKNSNHIQMIAKHELKLKKESEIDKLTYIELMNIFISRYNEIKHERSHNEYEIEI